MATRSRTAITLFVALMGAIALGTFAAAQWRSEPGDQPRSAARALPPPIDADFDATAFREIAEARMPTVVSIRTLRAERTPQVELFGDEALRRFFGLPDGAGIPRERILEGAGSGFVIDDDGLVLTNNHVVENATRIEVVLFPDPEDRPSDVRRLDAVVLGRDPLTDSALLQLKDTADLAVAPLGDSDAMRPGDWVMAIGNPFALSHTVTVGVVSATSRPFPLEGRPQRMLQTDAAINPGNSGGPLINLRGEVVGVNTAIFSPLGPEGGNIGIGFAVPINLVEELIPRLREGNIRRGRLGVQIRDVPAEAARALGLDEPRGALVASIEPDSPAERAGIEPGDVIVEYGDEPIDEDSSPATSSSR